MFNVFPSKSFHVWFTQDVEERSDSISDPSMKQMMKNLYMRFSRSQKRYLAKLFLIIIQTVYLKSFSSEIRPRFACGSPREICRFEGERKEIRILVVILLYDLSMHVIRQLNYIHHPS